MGQIVVLDRNMINMIAAGEVIERPANVVKELVENSIDAGATKITVSIQDGGRKLISVTDNGRGMDAEDLIKAFEPHTTSKIKNSSDLLGISTLGFRGEALSSIASVAQVRAISRTKDSTSANCIEIDCGNTISTGPCSADHRTTIQVRDIFYKLPARRKFLKTANTEMSHITEHFIRIALSNCELDMTLISNKRELYNLPGQQGLRQRIATLFSSEISEGLLETESSEKQMHIFALLGSPAISRTNNKFQYVFLNNRFIRDKFISHAVKEAYRGYLEPNRFPVIFLFIKMPYEDYDVNVHPTKIEVRFFNSNLVYSQILACLREKLLGTNLEAHVTLSTIPGKKDGSDVSTSAYRNQKITDAVAEFLKKHKPADSQQHLRFNATAVAAKHHVSHEKPISFDTIGQAQRKFLQIQDSFIVTEADDGFIIIDQHALHERIIYENLNKRIQHSNLESQKLLIPESLELTDAQADVVKSNKELIEKLGIELTPFGPKTYAIQAFPSLLANASPVGFVRDLIDLLTDKDSTLNPDQLLDAVLNMAACKAAIKAGQKLSDSEMQQLFEDREKTEHSNLCPHGRPTTIKFPLSQLERQFKRT
jgi:DNA mismatch repair protein MutL